jgi:predicted dehydrogenase
MAEPLRLGVVGANPNIGWASRTHLPALLALPEFELAAVCTTKRESAEASAEKYDAKRSYWNHRDLVTDPEVEVVDVCVRVPYHHEIVMAALEAGKHVYCEWPLAATVAQAVEMADLASQRGLHTMVGLQARGAPSINRMRQLIADGWIGRVHSATMTQLTPGLLQERTPDAVWRGERTNGAHTLSIAAGHAIDAFCWCVGPFVDVAGIVDTLAPEWPLQGGSTIRVTAPDYVTLTGRLESGAVATVTVGSVPWHAAGFRMEVFGTEGTLVATGGSNQVQAVGVRLQGARRDDKELVDIEIPAELRWAPAEVPSGTPVNVAQMMRRFAEGIRDGAHPEPTFADAVRNHRLLDAIVRASVSGTTVKVQR